MIDLNNIKNGVMPILVPLKAKDVTDLRLKMGVSQAVMAQIFNCSLVKIKKWVTNPETTITGADLVLANKLMEHGLSDYLAGETPLLRRELISLLGSLTEPKRGKGKLISDNKVDHLKAILGLNSGDLDKENALSVSSGIQIGNEIKQQLINNNFTDAAIIAESVIRKYLSANNKNEDK